MKKLLILLLIIILIVVIFRKDIEYFEGKDKNGVPEFVFNMDKVYTKLYDITFNEKTVFNFDVKKILPTLNKSSKILDAGTGTGKYYEYFFKKYNITGIDASNEMLKLAQTRVPLGTFIQGNLINDSLFKNKEFTHILCLLDTLYHNRYVEQALILKNFYYWLKDGGYLFIHVFNKKKLIPAPRNYSKLYVDKHKNLHSYTELDDFSHDAFYIHKKDHVVYKERYKMNTNGNIRFQLTKLYIPDNSKKTIAQILEVGFKLVNRYNNKNDEDMELLVFKK